jgi:hypothetical protein
MAPSAKDNSTTSTWVLASLDELLETHALINQGRSVSRSG